MKDENDQIYQSPPSKPDDEFWLEHGRKLIEGSFQAVHDAAKALMTGLGLLKGIYLGILGFSDFIPETTLFSQRILFLSPLILWLLALHFCLSVMRTQQLSIHMFSPDDIRAKSQELLKDKQFYLNCGFWTLAIGLVFVMLLFIYRLSL